MFYLFILESIGTAELLLIGLVALIIFGPRKLPELARMLGKARNEFKRTTDDFKQTWEREVSFENIDKDSEIQTGKLVTENSIQSTVPKIENKITVPEIKEISQTHSQEISAAENISTPKPIENTIADKRDWL